MYVTRQDITVTTIADGSATAYSSVVTGKIHAIKVTVGTLDNTVDLAITSEATGEAIATLTNVAADAVYYPRNQVHGNTGTGLTLDGTRINAEAVRVASDRIKIVAAQGGNVHTGTVTLVIE